VPLRCAALPIALPFPIGWGGQSSGDQPVGWGAVTLIAAIFEPSGLDGVGAEVLCANFMVLAADHAPKPREEALSVIGMGAVAAVSLGVVDALLGEV
jgi:hypothetical protein